MTFKYSEKRGRMRTRRTWILYWDMETLYTYVGCSLERVDDVIRQTGEQINDKPSFKIVHSNDFRVRYDLATRSDECRMEIQNDIDEKYDVYNPVNDDHGNVVVWFSFGEGNIERHCHSRIKSKQ